MLGVGWRRLDAAIAKMLHLHHVWRRRAETEIDPAILR